MTTPPIPDPEVIRHDYAERLEVARASTRGLGVVLSVVIALGLASTVASVVTARGQQAASRADVERNARLTQQLRSEQERNAREAKTFREDSRRLTLAICDQIEAVARQARLEVPPCPRVATSAPPSPVPSPSPTS